MGEILGKCVGLISGSEWQKVRSVTEVPFLHHNSTHYLTNIERRTKSHFESLHACGRLSQGLLNPVDDLKLLPFWIIADIVYHELSPEMETWLKALVPLRELLFQRVVSGGLPRFWWSQYFPAKANKELAEFKDKWATFNNAAHQRSLASSSNAPIEYMYGEMRSGRISPEQLYQTLDEVLFANLDVTIGGISWNLLFLGAYNDSQADLRAEVVDQSRAARGVRSRWEQYLLSSSTLLAATIFESARLKPLAAFSVPQAAPTDRAVGDFVIPAGTNFIIDSYALNIRNPYWGNDSSKYRPTRFLERNKTETRYHYWRFGFGTRTCMGRYVADSILKTILVHLVKNYKLSLLEDGKEWNRDSKTWITHPKTDVRCERIISESRQD